MRFTSLWKLYAPAPVVCFILATAWSTVHGQFVKGTVQKCDVEDEIIFVEGISTDPCITCKCKNGEVTCFKERCPDTQGCHYVIYDATPSNSCCDVCKGCMYQGRRIASGEVIAQPGNPCKVLECKAAVLTVSEVKCHVPCKNPIRIPGKCCPVCPNNCEVGNKRYRHGQTFLAEFDKCVTCTCQNGHVSCEKKSCPVLNCPREHIYTPEGACCPQCKGKRSVFDLGQRKLCYFRNRIFSEKRAVTSPDKCTKCYCVDHTTVCSRPSCPVLDCPRDEIVLRDGECCPRCQPRATCRFKGKDYRHGVMWAPDVCTTCSCDNGTVRCEVDPCHHVAECPKNSRLEMVPGQCCPVCVDTEAVCTVFGDPHYRTFDGRIFNFQGRCSYILARDCDTHDFDIRVRNYARMTNSFSWTKSISVRVGKQRIQLRQKLKAKVNGKFIQMPYVNTTSKFSVYQGAHTLTLNIANGVKVIWDGDSYLEVTVSPQYKQKMCGLCGNFNNIEADDLIGRDGIHYYDPDDFAETWKVKGQRSCKTEGGTRRLRQHTACERSVTRWLRSQQQCSLLQSAVFSSCHSKVDVNPFYRSCVMDMCDCPKMKQCSCEAIMAYSRACKQVGITLPGAMPARCGTPKCQRGAVWNDCASACPLTCNNWSQPRKRCNKKCIPSCQCLPGLVLQHKRCVQPSKCRPSRRKSKTDTASNIQGQS